MLPSPLLTPLEDNKLARWAAESFQREPTHSNIVYFGSPDERFVLVVQVDDPVQGYLVELHLEGGNKRTTTLFNGKFGEENKTLWREHFSSEPHPSVENDQ